MRNPEAIRTDVLVVGAGPAGLSVAENTAKNNIETLVVEKRKRIGYPICTTGGSFIEDIERLGIPSDLYHPTFKARVISPNNTFSITFDKPVACIMDVTGVFEFLADRAKKAGAKIQIETRGIKPLTRDNYVIGAIVRDIQGEEKEIISNVLVDSTGHRASMLTQANIHPQFKRFGVGAEYDMTAPNYDQDEIVVAVGSQVAPSGYAWLAPWGKGRVKIGIGIIHPDSMADPRKYLDELVNNASKYKVNLKGGKINEQHFGLIPSDGPAKAFVGNGIIGVGDSVGQASVLIGEGIRQSIDAGILAGKTITKAVKKNDFSYSSLKEYPKAWKRGHKIDLFVAPKINKITAALSDKQLDFGVELVKSLSPEEISEILHSGFNIKHVKLLVSMIPQALKQITNLVR